MKIKVTSGKSVVEVETSLEYTLQSSIIKLVEELSNEVQALEQARLTLSGGD